MNILFAVHQFFPNHYTGTERVVLNLCKQFRRMGHSVTVLTYGLLETSGFRTEGNCYVKEYGFESIRVVSVRHIQMTNEVSFSVFDNDIEQFCDGFLARENFDIIHVCHPMRVGSVIRSAKKRNIPVILTSTDFWLMCPRGIGVTPGMVLCRGSTDGKMCYEQCYGGPWEEKIAKRFRDSWEVFRSVNRVVCATEFLKGMYEAQGYAKDIVINRFGTDYNNIVPNARMYDEKSELKLGYLSYFSFHKGAHILVDAFCRAGCPNLTLVIYGETSGDKDYLAQLTVLRKKCLKIEYRGKYSYEDLPVMLNDLDIVVLPSLWWENSPLVLLSSLAHDVPAIVSDLGGMTENIKNCVNGFAFRTGDAEDLARIIKEIGNNPTILNTLKKQISHPPRIEAEAFFYEQMYESLVSALNDGHKTDPLVQEPVHAPQITETPADPVVRQVPPSSATIEEIQKKYGTSFVMDLHPNDAMYQFLVNHPDINDPMGEYFKSGESMLVEFREILADQKIDIHSIDSFLDFASGYGRFTRFLIFSIPSKAVTVCDIDKNAVDFCREKFKTDGFYSSVDPNDSTVRKKYDVIWVASLFSHLSLKWWKMWLTKLSGLLNPNGILIFSTHGCHCYELLDETTKQKISRPEEGFLFFGQSELDNLSKDVYGTTYVTEKFVRNFIEKHGLGKVTGYYPVKLWSFQDVYVLKKEHVPQPGQENP